MKNLENVSGRIFDIQKFSVHDGPGIRTIVFLKGCSLRCQWCCNPESQSYEIETMLRNGEQTTVGKDVTAGEVMQEVMKDMPYYKRSGGGLTLSGGECLCQPEFANALLALAKQNGINTAIETTANVKLDSILDSLEHIDLFLLDIKHMDSRKHREFTSVGNEQIHRNAREISRRTIETSKDGKARLIVRVPVIPTFNDTKEEISAIANFAVELHAKELHLLPYHRLGYDKYVGLSREYLMGDVESPSKQKMEELRSVAESCGIQTQIGG